ncbi:MAG: glutamate-5-semialdehyde dehydrogenase, partial [Saprospiraceae bacterium]
MMKNSTRSRADVLNTLSRLLSEERAAICQTNQEDMSSAPDDLSLADRLYVDDKKIDGMILSLTQAAAYPDPDDVILYEFEREDGLRVTNQTVPFGRILIIYESRPDVTVEAAAMAFKSGNSIMLKGGKEARNTNLELVRLWHLALEENGYPTSFISYLDISRDETQKMIADPTARIDLIIPRGGDALIDFVLRHSRAPVIISGRGNNFIYVHDDAPQEMVIALAINGKQRISVCNATDKILIHRDWDDDNVKSLIVALKEHNIEVLGDESMASWSEVISKVHDQSIWYEEFLAAKMMIGRVGSIEIAIENINKYSGGHSASIVTPQVSLAKQFMKEVDCAAVYHNASTRYTD